ncbi:MAG: hypothetical protein ABIU77_02390 [Ferruginibacter sp.]
MTLYQGTIIKTDIDVKASPYPSTYTITVQINLADKEIVVVANEEALTEKFGITFKNDETMLPDFVGRQCEVICNDNIYYFNRFIND